MPGVHDFHAAARSQLGEHQDAKRLPGSSRRSVACSAPTNAVRIEIVALGEPLDLLWIIIHVDRRLETVAGDVAEPDQPALAAPQREIEVTRQGGCRTRGGVKARRREPRLRAASLAPPVRPVAVA
jgi:hypothetical protein